MRARVWLSTLIVTAPTVFAATPRFTLEAATDRPDALYRRGETVTFRLTLKDGTRPMAREPIEYRISKDGVGAIKSGTVMSAESVATVTASLDEAGFIRCDASAKPAAATQPVTAAAGAGVELSLIHI